MSHSELAVSAKIPPHPSFPHPPPTTSKIERLIYAIKSPAKWVQVYLYKLNDINLCSHVHVFILIDTWYRACTHRQNLKTRSAPSSAYIEYGRYWLTLLCIINCLFQWLHHIGSQNRDLSPFICTLFMRFWHIFPPLQGLPALPRFLCMIWIISER